ncbi:MAG: 50S ribosomal protein L21 [Arenicellales bacterium]|jgi:large subunit ribosomal protein L21|nr:50S ribosomal protein L21 [Arenicellales bacterium]
MYAIIADSGKQFKVQEGQQVAIDYRDIHAGDRVTFDRVLCVSSEKGVEVGMPTVDGATVEAEVLGVVQGPKLVVQKVRRRKNSRRKTGHRQLYTEIRIDKISV